MKVLWSSRGLFIIGFVLVLLTNLVVLLGVSSNRSGEPTTLIELTERELSLAYSAREENSGLSLQLVWRTMGENEEEYERYGGWWKSPAWFNGEKAAELGFTPERKGSSNHSRKPVAKEVFIVLEYDGEGYQGALRRAKRALEKADDAMKAKSEDKELGQALKRAQQCVEEERLSRSRLFAVDAGLDAGTLRTHYPDRARFIVAPGVVSVRYDSDKEGKARGHISKMSVQNIHVPLSLRGEFDSILALGNSRHYKPRAPRYLVEVAYGSRFEPWIRSVKCGVKPAQR